MRRKEQLIDHGLIKLFLFALVMLTPFTLWAEDYPITVAGIQVTSDNAENVLNDDETPTVVFNALTNTLTLNGATIDMSETPGYCPIESSIANLTIHLIGYNSFTPNSDNYNGIRYSVGTTAGSLSFTTEDKNGYGSLKVNGIYSFTDFVSGYNVTNSFVTGAQTGWAKEESGNASSYYKSVMIRYIEYYNVWIGGVQLSSVNLSPVSGGTVYIPSTHTLHLAGYSYNDEIKSGLPELIVEVSGTYNTLSSLKFQPTDAVTSGTLTIKKDSDPYINTCKLTLSNAESGVITNFSSVTIKDPMKLVTPSTTPTWDDDVHAAVISNEDEQFYGIIVGATQVTDFNAADVLGDGTVKYFPDSKTLLLNGANIVNPEGFDLNAAITISTPSNLENVKLQGTNIIDANGSCAFQCDNETELEMTFSTDDTSGQLVMKNGGDGFFVNVSPAYDNNLVISSNTDANKILIAQGAIMSPGLSVYWPDQEYTISGSGTNIKYQDYMGHFAETSYTGKFTMATTGRYNVAITQTLTVDDTPFNQTVGGNIYSVRNKPTFNSVAGTYTETQHVKIENLPEGLAASVDYYPQVWYYLDENTNDSIQYTSAAQEIEISESTKVCVYIIDEDSGKKMKSKVVEAEYVILQDPNLQFVQGETAVTAAEYTIGGTDNPALPTLKNTNEVSVTYESSAPAVATIAADGTVTPVGVGYTTITATSTATSEYEAGEASYTLNVYKDLSHSSITVEVANVTYNGQAKTPTVTVKDGDKVLMYGEDNGGGTLLYEYKVEYANNTNAGLATAETGAPTVTVTAYTDDDYLESHMEVTHYRGSTTKTFTINKAQLTVTPDDKTYNVGDDITLTVSYEGFVNGETETVLTTQPTASYGTADVTKPGSYEITASGGVAQNYDFIYETGTLTVNRQLNVSFSASNTWATYCGTENLAMPEGLKAYQVTAVEGATVTISEIGYIPANTAVLLQNVSNNNVWTNIAASAYTGATSTFENNKLIGTASAVDVSTITGGTVYILVNNMFRRSTSGSIPANRGYLVVEPSAVNAGNAPQLSITIGDENTTAISNTDFTDNTDKAGEWYSIDGVKLNGQPQKPGLYIKNGKKVFINKK